MTDVNNVTPSDIQNHLRRELGRSVHYKVGWRARRQFIEQQNTSAEVSYQLILPFFEWINTNIPGSIAVAERDSIGRFRRSFVLLEPLIRSLMNTKPLLSFDACSLKGPYKGILMCATMTDGLTQILPLAWGTAGIEDEENWTWFVNQLVRGVPILRNVPTEGFLFTVFSDREKGIWNAVRNGIPHSNHVYCVKHIEKNICTKFKYKSKLLWTAAKCLNIEVFNDAMQRIRDEDPRVYDYLYNIDNRCWTTAYADFPKWEHVTSNISESLNNWLNDVRDQSIFGLHEGLHTKVADLMHRRRLALALEVPAAVSYQISSTPLPRVVARKVDRLVKKGQKYRLETSASTFYRVVNEDNQRNVGIVDLLDRPKICSCMVYFQTGLPCVHICAVIGRNPEMNVLDFIHRAFRFDTLRAVYEPVIPLLDKNILQADGITLPPIQVPQAGRPRKLRIRSRGEYVGMELESPIHCMKCGRPGHNIRTCERRRRAEQSRPNQG
jgi:hypothetical protein